MRKKILEPFTLMSDLNSCSGAAQKGKSPELAGLKSKLSARRLTHRQLAEELRIPFNTIRKVCCGSSSNEGVRHAIEDFLGLAIWSSEVEFRRRNGKRSDADLHEENERIQ